MKGLIKILIIIGSYGSLFSQNDWDNIAVPANAGVGKVWELQPTSDNFNYTAPANNKGTEFYSKWRDTYHSAWTGPGLTVWSPNNSSVSNGLLQMVGTRVPGTNKTNTGCMTSKQQVTYPAYVETRAKIMNSVLANAVWMLSSDDTQEIDILEAYGASYSESAQAPQTWYAQRIHLSHHVFIRSPLQDYQPTDAGSWYTNGSTLWRNDYHRYGVYWKDPWNLEYYIDGQLVRTVSGVAMIDPNNYTSGTGLNKPLDIVLSSADQTWRTNQNITPTDNELANTANNTFNIDWIRVYKPVNAAVPVTLASFTAVAQNKTSLISWQTASEQNNDYFEVLKSVDGKSFSTISTVKGNGTTSTKQDYSVTDKTPSVGANYYKLRQVDFDGKESFSKVVAVNFGRNATTKVYPTHATDNIHIALSGGNEGATDVLIINLLGQVVKVQKGINTEGVTTIPISNLAIGSYLLQLVSKSGSESFRFEKQ